MPLYTYIACYKGRSHADQDRRSNYRGFAAIVLGRMPEGALPGLTSKSLRQEMVHKAFRSEWTLVSNRKNARRSARHAPSMLEILLFFI